MIVCPTPPAFLIIGVSPYLSIDETSQAWLQKHFVRITRQFHPDLIPADASDEAKEKFESQLSEFNTAFNAQKDLGKRIKLFLEAAKESHPSLFNLAEVKNLPPQFAIQYFELQELIEESPSSEESLLQLREFENLMKIYLKELDAQALKISQKFSFKMPEAVSNSNNSGSPNKTWSIEENDLKELSQMHEQKKYVDRLLENLQSNFLSIKTKST